MNEKFIQDRKEELESEKQRIEKELEEIKDYPDYGSSGESRVMELEDYQNDLGLGKDLLTLLNETKSALARIEKGTYGVCESCKEEIETGRLKAFPAAILCSTCANKRHNG